MNNIEEILGKTYTFGHHHYYRKRNLKKKLTKAIEKEILKAVIDELGRLFVDHDERKIRVIEPECGTRLMTIPDRTKELNKQLENL